MTASRQPIPWTRVLVEGVVIVGSILMAFGIEAWWDGAQERAEEAQFLASLAEDFRASRSEAESVISTYERTDRLLARLTSLTPDQLRSDSPDSLTAMVSALASPRTFDPILGTLDALISAGKMNVLSDAELREALTSFRNMVDDAKEDEAYLSHFAIRVWEAEIPHGGPWRIDVQQITPGGRQLTDMSVAPIPTADDAIRLRQDEELMSLSRWTQFQGAMYVGEIRRVGAQIDAVLALIENSLAFR